MTNQPSTRICILGGGFGGLYTALRLSEFPLERSHNLEITLVDRNDRFLFSPLLYELVTREMQTWEIAPSFVELLEQTNVKFCQGCVTGLNPQQQRVFLADGTELPYDKLVVALGGKTPLSAVPGAAERAIPFRRLEDFHRLETRLRELEQSDRSKIRVAIVGGGYSGVELACKLSERLGDRGRIRIIERSSDILSKSTEFNRQTAKAALEDHQIWLDLETEIQSVEPDAIALEYKGQVDTIPVELVMWTVGTQATELLEQFPLKRTDKGLLAIAPTFEAIGTPNIFALGDLADCRDAAGQQIPATAQAALQQADYCAWNLWASLTNRPLLPFRYQPLGEMMTLGTDRGTVSGLGVKLDGILGHLTRRLVYLYRLPTPKHQLAVGFNWMAQPLIELLS
ncbi:MAG: NAD(P)/FAD-dependent oxidoreductase [Cyanobacteriota bacterium]|nr:NAD(P)/FAD-dependent oxidoreductase [Cyanobacteriota bacterium]